MPEGYQLDVETDRLIAVAGVSCTVTARLTLDTKPVCGAIRVFRLRDGDGCLRHPDPLNDSTLRITDKYGEATMFYEGSGVGKTEISAIVF